jgi:hypothetical protein
MASVVAERVPSLRSRAIYAARRFAMPTDRTRGDPIQDLRCCLGSETLYGVTTTLMIFSQLLS